MPATILDTWDTSVNRMGKNPCPYGSHILYLLEGGITDRSFGYAMTYGRNTEGCGTGGLLRDHSWEMSH